MITSQLIIVIIGIPDLQANYIYIVNKQETAHSDCTLLCIVQIMCIFEFLT